MKSLVFVCKLQSQWLVGLSVFCGFIYPILMTKKIAIRVCNDLSIKKIFCVVATFMYILMYIYVCICIHVDIYTGITQLITAVVSK